MFNEVFQTTIFQMIVLFLFIIIGYVLRKTNILKQDSIRVLSKLVSTIFLPLVLVKSFMTSFTIDELSNSLTIILYSAIIVAITIVICLIVGKLIIKNDDWLKKMYQYGLFSSNFVYMGIPIIQAVAPEFESEYLIFTIVPQFAFTLWALPSLLIPAKKTDKFNLKDYLQRLLNPIFICLLLGVILGLTGAGNWIKDETPFIYTFISNGASCMSPLAMILTGVVAANYNIVKCFKDIKIYIISILRLIVIPGLIALIFVLVRPAIWIDELMLDCLFICTLTYLAMPIGLNNVIIPAGYGKDVVDCAGMVLISNILGIITIPLIFAIFLSL